MQIVIPRRAWNEQSPELRIRSEIMQLLRQCGCLLEQQRYTFKGAFFPSQVSLLKECCQRIGQTRLVRVKQATTIVNCARNVSRIKRKRDQRAERSP